MVDPKIHQIALDLQAEGKLPLIEIHMLRPVAGALMNCDMNGRQKTIDIGGVTRNRLSSQSIKFALRSGALTSDDLQTRFFPALIAGRVKEKLTASGDGDKTELGVEIAKLIFDKTKTDKKSGRTITNQILKLADSEVEAHVNVICDAVRDAKPGASARKIAEDCRKNLAAAISTARLSPNIALFGRMATTDGVETIYSATQFGHAYGINPANGDYDDFVATDDYIRQAGIVTDENASGGQQTGTAILQTRDIGADVFYEYANVATIILFENLMRGRDVSDEAIEETLQQAYEITKNLTKAIITTYPVAHGSTMLSAPEPAAVCICRSTRKPALTFDAEFEQPIYRAGDLSVAQQGVRKMARAINAALHGTFADDEAPYDGVYWLASDLYDDVAVPDGATRATIRDVRDIIVRRPATAEVES